MLIYVKAYRYSLVIFAAFFCISSPVNAQVTAPSTLQYYPIQEALPNGKVHFKLIEEDTSLRAHQEQISQHVIYDAILAPTDLPSDLPAFIAKVVKQQPAHAQASPRFPVTAKPLWVPVKDAWTQADEDAYSAWFATVKNDFDSGTGLLADCADVGLLFRWVYARNNLLPIANTMSGSGKLFGHFSSNSDWDRLATNADWKQDERFKAALRYLFDNTYTRTVIADLFPTIVSPQYVRPGSMFMIIRPTDGHTQTIHSIDSTSGFTTYLGNEPAAETIYISSLIVEVQNKLTLGMWRQVRKTVSAGTPQWELTPAAQMPGYSLAQFQQVFNSNEEYTEWLDGQIGIQVTDQNRLRVLADAFYQGIQSRLQVTASSIPYCIVIPCAVNGTDYNNYSTFAKDARLSSEQKEIAGLIQKLGQDSDDVAFFLSGMKQYGEVIRGSGLMYLDLLQNPALLAKFNPDPRVSYETRWGIQPATADPALDLYANAQALFNLLGQRNTEVLSGISICRENCDANSASVKNLNTVRLDAGIKTVYQLLMNSIDSMNSMNPDAMKTIRAHYAEQTIYYLTDSTCLGLNGCTLDDLVFGGAATTHFSKWSPNAQDPVKARWGY